MRRNEDSRRQTKLTVVFVVDNSSAGAWARKRMREALQHFGNLLSLSDQNEIAHKNICIGLAIIRYNRVTQTQEVHQVLKSTSPFELRAFHHGLDSMADLLDVDSCFNMERESKFIVSRQISCLSKLIKDVREDHPSHAQKKIVVLLDHITEEEITFRHTISEAEYGGVELDFVCMTEQQQPEGIDRFRKAISGHRHCQVRQVSFESSSLDRMGKELLMATRLSTGGEHCQAAEISFSTPLIGSTSTIRCKLQLQRLMFSSLRAFQHCTCFSKPLSGPQDRPDPSEFGSSGLTIGNVTSLHLPSFVTTILKEDSEQNVLHVRVQLDIMTLSEALVVGESHVVTWRGQDDNPVTEQKVFSAMCKTLLETNRALLCESATNFDDIEGANLFSSFYVLLPLNSTSLLMKTIITSEEILPITPTPSVDSTAIDAAVRSRLMEDEAVVYNPLKYRRGCHSVLARLVNQSLAPSPLSPTTEIRANTRSLHPTMPSLSNEDSYGSCTTLTGDDIDSHHTQQVPATHYDFQINMGSRGKGSAFRPRISQGPSPQQANWNTPSPHLAAGVGGQSKTPMRRNMAGSKKTRT